MEETYGTRKKWALEHSSDIIVEVGAAMVDGIVIQILFCLLIIVYWFSEGVTEGWKSRKRKN